MRELVMKVDKFFNISGSLVLTVLGGVLECDIKNGETVTIVCPGDSLTTAIEKIKRYSEDLKEANRGETVGLTFFGLHHMAFRVTEPIVNPYSPRDNLAAYLRWDSQENDAEGVMIYREVCDATFTKEGCERDSEGNYPKPNFLFLHGSE
jgi:hypothetical protein